MAMLKRAHIVDDASKLKVGEFEKRNDVTFMFVDIRGFTSLTHEMAKAGNLAVIQDILNTYIPITTRIILEHNGTIDKYNGDGIMAVFGYPQAATARDAINAAAGIMTDGLDNINRVLDSKGQAIEIGIGMEFGKETFASVLGDPHSPDGHKELTMIADSVNHAAKLEKLAKPGTILIGPALRQQLLSEGYEENSFRDIPKGELNLEQSYLSPTEYIYREGDRLVPGLFQ